jgi:uncharacterized protein (DUF924 family)
VEHGLRVSEILEYWFGSCIEEPQALEACTQRWFNNGQTLDHEIQSRFGDLPPAIAAIPADGLDDAISTLATVIALDQFPRHIYRGQAKAFAFDQKALQLLDIALKQGWDKQLHPLQASFLYMPLQHAEDLERQQQGVDAFKQLLERADDVYKPFVANNLKYAQLHHDIIERFGRFPYRNRALGRTDTPEEQAYLADNPRRFGQ